MFMCWEGHRYGLKIDAAFWRLEELIEELYEQTNRLTFMDAISLVDLQTAQPLFLLS